MESKRPFIYLCTLVAFAFRSFGQAPASPRDFVKDFGADQRAIWTSPKDAPKNVKWLAPLVLATGVLLATDVRSSRAMPNTRDQLAISSDIGNAGLGYIAAVPSALLVGGLLRHNAKARDTGLLAAEALADSGVVLTAMKYATMRQRPLPGNRDGDFFQPRFSPSFPSGHATFAWTVASVVAHRYSSSKAVVIASYGAATLISLSRYTGGNHFASDVMVGSAVGWLIGRYVVHSRTKPPTNTR